MFSDLNELYLVISTVPDFDFCWFDCYSAALDCFSRCVRSESSSADDLTFLFRYDVCSGQFCLDSTYGQFCLDSTYGQFCPD